MAYRQLTRDEIIQLGQELDDLRHWEGARDYVSALYGLDSTYSPHGHRPHQITISIVSEPQQNYRFRDAAIIIVTDAENNLIPYDFSRYWWSQFTLNKAAIEEFLRDTWVMRPSSARWKPSARKNLASSSWNMTAGMIRSPTPISLIRRHPSVTLPCLCPNDTAFVRNAGYH